MRTLLASIVMAALFVSATAYASEKTDAMATIHQFIDNMNKGDMQAAAAPYAPEASIIDEFPPHYWHGATAFADWGKDFGTDAQKHGDTDPFVKLGKPKHVDITDEHAYVVVPSSYAYKEHGKKVVEKGSTMTFALVKLNGAWKIAAWSWTRN